MNLVNVDLQEAVIAIAREAAAAILEVYAHAFEVEQKSDASPLTAADMAAHHAIFDGLQRLTPDWPILSEEDAGIPWETRRHWG
ncbi:MAG: inositol monophosphatase family protein, partial [Pseudoxanthomonas sp.]